jgi:heavy metal sensor kinase
VKLRTRIAIAITTLVAAILSIVALLTLRLVSAELHLGVDQALKLSVTQLVAMAEVEDGRLHLEERDDGHMAAPLGDDDLLRLVSTNGKIIDSRGLSDVPVDVSRLSDHLDYQTVSMSELAAEIRVATIPVYDDKNERRDLIAYLQVGKSLSTTNQTIDRIERLFVFLLPACFLFAGIASYFLANRALAPIEKIRLEAARASVDRLDEGILIDGLPDDEVGRLARTFDEMLRRLGTSFFRQRRFTADASHELRTPVSNMRGVAEVALSKPRTEEEYKTALLTILNETKSMTRLIKDLLFLARSDSDRLHLEPENLELQEVLSALGDDFSDGKRNLDLKLDAPLPVFVDKDRFLQVMLNLLENCSTHAPDSDVLITGKVVEGKVQLIISDNGPGIEPQHLAHITERFYRVDPARTRQSTSSGLGLSIALEIMKAHGGSLWVESDGLGQGTKVYLEVPRR